MEQATIFGVISTLEKYSTEDAKRILFKMAQDLVNKPAELSAPPTEVEPVVDVEKIMGVVETWLGDNHEEITGYGYPNERSEADLLSRLSALPRGGGKTLTEGERQRIVNHFDRPNWSRTAALNECMKYLHKNGYLSGVDGRVVAPPNIEG